MTISLHTHMFNLGEDQHFKVNTSSFQQALFGIHIIWQQRTSFSFWRFLSCSSSYSLSIRARCSASRLSSFSSSSRLRSLSSASFLLFSSICSSQRWWQSEMAGQKHRQHYTKVTEWGKWVRTCCFKQSLYNSWSWSCCGVGSSLKSLPRACTGGWEEERPTGSTGVERIWMECSQRSFIFSF